MTTRGDDAAPTIVVFDVGEVLIDETRVWSVWADILGVSPLTFGAVLGAAIVQGMDWPAAFAELAPNVEWQEFLEEHERRYGGFRAQDLYSDVRPCLRDLRRDGVRVVVAGNQPARRTRQLQALDLPVDALATSEDLGAEKPAPAFFAAVMALAAASDPGEVLYVGDRVDNDVVPAATFGMRTCWLRRGPWGVLQDIPDVDGSRNRNDSRSDTNDAPDLVLEGLGELPTLLADWRAGTTTP